MPVSIINYSKSENPIYRVELVCEGHNIGMQMDMPEQLVLGVSSEFESRLTTSIAGVLNSVTGGAAENMANLMGAVSHLQALSFQMWVGTTPIEIPLTFLFDAEEDANFEVYQPIAQLQSIALPVNGTGTGLSSMLHPPGPRYGLSSKMGAFGLNTTGYGIDVKFGRMMLFKDCILVSATATYDSRLDSKGFPMSGQVECTFRTPLVYGRTDWLKAMQLPSNGTVIGEGNLDDYKGRNFIEGMTETFKNGIPRYYR